MRRLDDRPNCHQNPTLWHRDRLIQLQRAIRLHGSLHRNLDAHGSLRSAITIAPRVILHARSVSQHNRGPSELALQSGTLSPVALVVKRTSVEEDQAGTAASTRNESIGIHIRFAPESASMGNSIRTRLFR